MSLDAEGLDLASLNCWDFERYRPAVFCIETLNLFADHTKFRKNQRLIQFMDRQRWFPPHEVEQAGETTG